MILSWKTFTVNLKRMDKYLQEEIGSNYDGMVCDQDQLKIMFLINPSPIEQDIVNDYWDSLTEQGEITPTEDEQLIYIQNVINSAIGFGQKIITEFAAENVAMGITQAGMTATVRRNLSDVTNCLLTGSLYDAIDQIRAIPAEDKDPIFVTDARLLIFINKIEAYLGIPLSTEL